MSVFERYLGVWVAMCIVAGIALGHFLPAVFQSIAAAQIAQVNLPVAVLVWLMVVGVLIKMPVMLSIVSIVNKSKGWYGRGSAVSRNQL